MLIKPLAIVELNFFTYAHTLARITFSKLINLRQLLYLRHARPSLKNIKQLESQAMKKNVKSAWHQNHYKFFCRLTNKLLFFHQASSSSIITARGREKDFSEIKNQNLMISLLIFSRLFIKMPGVVKKIFLGLKLTCRD